MSDLALELKPHRETVELLASVEKGIRDAIEQAECFGISRDRIEPAAAHKLAAKLLRDLAAEEQAILLRGAVAARIMQTSYFLPLEWPDSEPAA